MVKNWKTLAVLALILAGCPGEEHGVEEELCEHLTGGEAVAITAAETNPPAIAADHRRYEVTLADVGGQKGGSVSFVVDHGGDYVFGLNADLPLQVRDANAAVVAAESVEKGSEACAELAAIHTYVLPVGTVTLTFGPTTVGTVSMVAEHSHEEAH